MKLYALPGSLNSRKLLALIHHLALQVEIVAMTVEQVQSDHYAAINPNRLAPTLVDGDFILWESNAIGVYLAHESALIPTGLQARMDMLRWLHWEGIHFNKALGTIFFEAVVRPQLGWGATNQTLVDDALQQAGRYLPVLDSHLANRLFILGDRLSFVDFAMASAEPYRDRLSIEFDRFPNVQRFYDRVAALPAWQKALRKAPVAVAA
ncbi:MAG: glutathione S-transferase [Rhodospirillales bacterium]|nr:glutathione S-transferase [Rhodospirillales bacterium]